MPAAHGSAMQRRRDKWGTLIGGEQNETMQRHVVEENTFKDREHNRWLAHREAALHATFPTEFVLNGVEIPIFKMAELEQLGAKRIKERCMNMRDRINASKCNFFGHHPEYVLNASLQPEVLMQWIIDVQVKIAQALGQDDLDHAAFGATASDSVQYQAPSGNHHQQGTPAQRRPCWSQEAMLEETQAKIGIASPPRPQQSFPWSQHGVANDFEAPPTRQTPGQWRSQPPSHQGFSLVPPSMDASQESAFIRHRHQASVITLG